MPTETGKIPDLDVNDGGWTEQGTGTDSDGDLFDEVDEGTTAPDDATTYIRSANNILSTDASVLTLSITDITEVLGDITAITGCTVRFRARKNVTDNDNAWIHRWDIQKGGTATNLATSNPTTSLHALTTSWADYTNDGTINDSTPTEWTGLKIKITGNTAAVGMADATKQVDITALEVDITYTMPGVGGTVVKDCILSGGIVAFAR